MPLPSFCFVGALYVAWVLFYVGLFSVRIFFFFSAPWIPEKPCSLRPTQLTTTYTPSISSCTSALSPGKKSKTEAMYCPARATPYEDGDTSDLVLDCDGTVSFTKSFVYLGSLLHCDLSDDRRLSTEIGTQVAQNRMGKKSKTTSTHASRRLPRR
jgi:hypothetical protein